MVRENALLRFADHQGAMILDGGIATTLESSGHNLNDPLWSAAVLLDAPGAVEQVHREFLEAGADCIGSVTYQATIPGFEAKGLDSEAAVRLLGGAVELAVQARDDFWSPLNSSGPRLRPLVAASLGPYGAFLADGSEYRGDYGLTVRDLYDFHRPQWRALTANRADLIACETIPSGREVEALLRLIEETPDVQTWISLSCQNGEQLADGTAVVDVARACDAVSGIIGVGVNCVPPERVRPVLSSLRKGTTKPLLAYPNSGEEYDPDNKTWRSSESDPEPWVRRAVEWQELGAVGIGGCCRTAPADIAALREHLLDHSS